jgi:3-oxoacyl-[acyl-carrier protein] reductase
VSEMDLRNQVAIVTGGATGIGRAISLKLASCGATVVINYNSSATKADELVALIKEQGGQALAIKANVASFTDTQRLVNETVETFGQVDLLINNAGITRDTLMLRMKEEDFDAVIDTNLKGTWNMSKHASKVMMKSRRGKIINISSVVGLIGNIGQTNYVASKAGVIGITKAMAKELAARNVYVNAVAPGFIKTDMTKDLSDDLINAYLTNIPLNRLGEAEDIANVVAFLASDLSNYMTGQVLNVCGGLVMN